MVLACLSQKGGCGKSTVARLCATEYAREGWSVLLADLDEQQQTSTRWTSRRQALGLTPAVEARWFRTAALALRQAERFDLLVVDGRPHASAETVQVARAAALTVLPTGIALDDLEPAVRLAHELQALEVPVSRIAFALVRVGDSPAELEEAREYLSQSGYTVLTGSIPERTAYRRALDTGRAPTETQYPTLNRRADELAQAVNDLLKELEQ